MDGGIREGRDSGEHPGTVGGRQPLHLQASGARAGLPGGLPGYPTLIWAASALFLGPSNVHTHAPRHTRLLAHTCIHADTGGHWTQRAHVLESKPLGPQRLSHLTLKHHQAKCRCVSQGPRTGLPGEKLFPQNEGETLLKRKRSADLAAVAVCRLFPVRDFFYSIFLAVIASLFAEGWERPSVSGTRPSVTVVQVCLVPRVWPHPDRHHQHLPRGSRDAPRCPPGPLPAAKPPRSETAWPGWPGGCAAAGYCSVSQREGL